MSALVSLVATFTLFTITLCVLAGQGQELLDDITSNLSIVFWEFVIAVPLLALVFIPLFLVTIAITITIVLPVLASIVLLVRITVNSPIFRQVLDLVSGCSPLIVRNVAQLGAWVTSIRTSAYASKLVAKLRPTPKTEPTATNALVTPIPALPEPLSTETTPLSTQYATQTEQSHLAHDSPNHPSLAGPTPDDTFQAEMELFATPAYQDTEMEPLDGHVDAPPTFGMSAPNTVDQGFQLGYTNNLSGTATVAGEHGLALAPNPWPFDNHGASGPDTMQVDRNTPPVSDAELLELAAAAMTAEGMEWVHDTLSSGTSGPSNQNTFALPLSDQELLELDNALQLAAASSVLQTSNDTLTTTNTHPNLEDSAPLPTDDELLELAGAAMAEDTAGMVPDNNTSIDFNLNFADIDMSFLDLSQLELPDQATQSVMGNFTNQVPNPSGALNSNELYTFNLADLPNSVHHIDPNEFARMWDELGASLKDWAGQFPGATDFSEDDMMRMLMELDAVDTT
ncbi:hypothetical protein FRC11_001929, partial [Ceratobasidium sp. 423]